MKTRFAVLFISSLLSVNSAFSATVQDIDQRLDFLFGSHQKFHDFFNLLQKSLAEENTAAVASLVSYPLNISLDGKKIAIHNQQEFEKHYASIFTPALRKAITDQKYEDLFARDIGVMVGDSGQLWFSEVCLDSTCKTGRVLITGINN